MSRRLRRVADRQGLIVGQIMGRVVWLIVQLWVVGLSERGRHVGITTTVVDVACRGRNVAGTVWGVVVVWVNVGGTATVEVLLVARDWNSGGLCASTAD